MHAGPIALAFAAAYLGAALYSVLVEQPARLTLDDRALVKEWAPSDRRALLLLALFALASAIAALVEFRAGGNALWVIKGLSAAGFSDAAMAASWASLKSGAGSALWVMKGLVAPGCCAASRAAFCSGVSSAGGSALWVIKGLSAAGSCEA